MTHPFIDLDHILFRFSTNKKDTWTIRDAVRGTQIFGAIGSGKSSGSGKTIAMSFLQNGFGGLVLCGKKDEREVWEKYARKAGRSESLIVFSPESDFRFNFLDYESSRPEGGGMTKNIVDLLMVIHEMGNRKGGGKEERFWDLALKRMLTNVVDLLKLAGEKLTMDNIYNLISSSPQDSSFFFNWHEMSNEEYVETVNSSYSLSCVHEARIKLDGGGEDELRTFNIVENYWLKEFAELAENTRSTIVESFLGIANPFIRGILHKFFATSTNIFPEMTHEGYIIILDFPAKEYLEIGVYAQSIFKLLWQQATERRKIEKGAKTRPVFLWVDEAQYFLNDYDVMFQTTARSSKACTVFLSQNISNYYSVLGSNAKVKADSLLANLSTKIFHANNDSVTNNWTSETIGKSMIARKTRTTSSAGGDTITVGGSETFNFEYQVKPVELSMLKTGGEENKLLVEAIVTTTGKIWSNDKNYFKASFNQIY